jgi:glycerophosphoryl diester phosphodiesterase
VKTTSLGALASLLFLAGCQSGGEPATPYTSEPQRVEVIAHRGASFYAPENTLAAFSLAIQMKADWFELDCTLSKDGKIVVIHDDTVDRTSEAEGAVANLTLAELKRLDVGSWKDAEFAGERIPTLAESLDLARERIGVFVEVKHSDDAVDLRAKILGAKAEARLALLEESGCVDLPLAKAVVAEVRPRVARGERIVVQSFSAIICAWVRLAAPDVAVELLVGDVSWEESVRWLDALDFAGLNPGKKEVDRARIAALRKRNKDVSVWTVNEAATMRKLRDWGVRRLISDVPDVCLTTLGR